MFILFNYLHLIRNFQEIMEIPSSSSSSSSNYDVFLSFRGVDTRKNFTDHLFTALKREGIHTFRDNVELEAGGSIGPELRKAIEGSKISIVVFSINYAWSRWCLDELAHIMKCRKELGQKVVPIFYNVQPNVVQHQTDSFRDAFAAHELRYKDDLGRWRAALGEAADLAGVDVQNHGDGYESTIINDIVKDICDKLNRKRLCVPTNLVGLDSRVDQVMSFLEIHNLDEIRMVGICGMGGIGKTTTAKQVYNSIFPNFEGSCFLTNIPQKPDCNDMTRLQNQLVSDILKVKHEDVYNVHRGFEMIQERLRDKRILIVVDDVSEIEQLKYILGNYTWLSCGSRIIITTRTLDLEKPSRGYHQYLVEVLDEGESLQLFSLHCFEECHPPKEYMKLAKSVICYGGGIPLALEVLGSDLSGQQSANVWKRRLEKLKAIPDRRIQDVLKTSYDCLDDMEKSLFLDIACFFVDLVDCKKDYVISILDDAPHFFAEDGINTLIKRCLIKVDSSNELVMHDLLLEMGREIVRRECRADPGKRSRVWDDDEAYNLLKDEKVTKAIEVFNCKKDINLQELINLQGSQADPFTVRNCCFRKMERLRLLRINHPLEFTGSFEHSFLSKQLRLVQWSWFPLESISFDLHPENLVALDMRNSKLKVLGEMKLPKLKFLYLSCSTKLTETPNFDGLPNLEIITLNHCYNLRKVHESICRLTKLVELNLASCTSLSLLPKLPSSLITLRASICELKVLGEMKLPKLKFLDLSCSWELTETPNFDGLPNLEILTLDGCDHLPKVHESICRLTRLVELNLDCCSRLCLLPKLPSSLITLKAVHCYSLITDLHLENLVALDMRYYKLKVWGEMKLPKLKFLDLSHSWELTETPNFDGLPNLEIIRLGYCVNLRKVHESICRLTKLVELNLDCCTRLCLLPKLPSSLITLVAGDCSSLITSKTIGCEGLERINLTNFHVLECFHKFDERIKFDGFFEEEPTGVGGGEKIVVLDQMEIQISTFQPRTRSAGTKISKFCVKNLSFSGFFYS